MHALGGQGQPAGVRNCFSPLGGLRWSSSHHQLSKQLYVVQPSWWPVFKWNNFKSIILLIIIKILSSFTWSFYKPFLTTPVCIDFACIGFDDFSMCWLVSKCFAPPAPTPSSSLPLTLFHVCISLCDPPPPPPLGIENLRQISLERICLCFCFNPWALQFQFSLWVFLWARQIRFVSSLRLINSRCLAVSSQGILCDFHLSPEAVTLLCPIPCDTHLCLPLCFTCWHPACCRDLWSDSTVLVSAWKHQN